MVSFLQCAATIAVTAAKVAESWQHPAHSLLTNLLSDQARKVTFFKMAETRLNVELWSVIYGRAFRSAAALNGP